MTFSLYVPSTEPAVASPALIYLSGLTCTDENFSTKSGMQKSAAANGLVVVVPDTSPRGLNIEGEDDAYDFGSAAGFYLNAIEPKWENYRMEEYITDELPKQILQEIKDVKVDFSNCSIMGHSMGGHGALTLGLKYKGQYKSISAFSPICNPLDCPWGIKAFTGYLGNSEEVKSHVWPKYDTCELMRSVNGENSHEIDVKIPILVDQGTADSFLESQLKTEELKKASAEGGFENVEIRMQDGYDHSYYFISTFIEDHINFHAKHLCN